MAATTFGNAAAVAAAPPLHFGGGGRGSKEAPPPARRHLGLCTEGLGSESSESSGDVHVGDDDDADEGYAGGVGVDIDDDEEEETAARTGRGRRAFPPPISVIGSGGKPWLYLRAHRGGGRLVLQEVRIPSRELLQACREDGRLKLHFAAHPEEEDDDDEPIQDQCHEQQINN